MTTAIADTKVWRCDVCNKVKELSGPHLNGKVTVRSDCWPCAKKRTFVLSGGATASPVAPSPFSAAAQPLTGAAAATTASPSISNNPFAPKTATAAAPSKAPAAAATATTAAAAAPNTTTAQFQFAGGKTGNPFVTSTNAPPANPFFTTNAPGGGGSVFGAAAPSPFVSAFSAPSTSAAPQLSKPPLVSSNVVSTASSSLAVPLPMLGSSPQQIIVSSIPRASPPFSFTAPPKQTAAGTVPLFALAPPAAPGVPSPTNDSISWRCAVCNKVKDLQGAHLNKKNSVRSDCWPCAKKRVFLRCGGDGKPLAEVVVVSPLMATVSGPSSTAAAGPNAGTSSTSVSAPNGTTLTNDPSVLERASSMQRATSGESVFLPPAIPSPDQQVQFFLGQVPQAETAQTLVSSFASNLVQSYMEKTRDGSLRSISRLYADQGNTVYAVLQLQENAPVSPRSVAEVAAVLMHLEATESKPLRAVYCPDVLTMTAAALYTNMSPSCTTAVCGPEVDRTRCDPCQLRAVLEETAATSRQALPRHSVVSVDSRLAAAKALLLRVGLVVPPPAALGEALRMDKATAGTSQPGGIDVVLIPRTVGVAELQLLRILSS